MAEKQTPKSKHPSRRIIFSLVGFAISGVALYFVFRGSFDLEKLVTYVERIRPVHLFLSLALYWGGVAVIRSFLIRHLLRSVGEVRRSTAYRYICIGFLVNNILPFRMGEGARIAGIAKRSKISVASTAGGLVVERLLDLTMAAVIGVIAIQLAPLPYELRMGILTTGGMLVTILIILGLVARRGLKETDSTKHGRLTRFVWNHIARFSFGFNALGNTKSAVFTVALSSSIWGVALCVYVLRLMAFDLPFSLPMSLVLIASISLGISIPSAPSAVGVYHGLAAGALVLMGVEKDLALGFAFFCLLADFLGSSAVGAVCMVLEGVGLSDLRASAASNRSMGGDDDGPE